MLCRSVVVLTLLAGTAGAAEPVKAPVADLRITLNAKARPLGALLRELEGLVHPQAVIVDKTIENVPVTVAMDNATPVLAFRMVLDAAKVPYGISGERVEDLRVVTGVASLSLSRADTGGDGPMSSPVDMMDPAREERAARARAEELIREDDAQREAAARPDLGEAINAMAAASAQGPGPAATVEVPADADTVTAAMMNGANEAAAARMTPGGPKPPVDLSGLSDPVSRAMAQGAAGQGKPPAAIDPNTIQDPVAKAFLGQVTAAAGAKSQGH